MTSSIDITELSAANRADETDGPKLEFGEPEDGLGGLGPWLMALAGEMPADVEFSRLEQVCQSLEDPGKDDTDARLAAARTALEEASDRGVYEAVVAGLYLMKRRGFEAGRSPGDRWRIHRVLNAGSRALDLMLEDPGLRRLSMEALFYRVLKMALQRGELEASGLAAEVSCAVEWNDETGEPLRRSLPEGADPDVVDWLLDELMTRGLTSMTLGSVIQEGRRGRDWEVDDAFGKWMGQLSGDEAGFVAGVLFCPARLGGWEVEADERLLDAFGVAQNIDDDFAPDESRIEAYKTHLRRIDGLRGLPENLSPTFEIEDDSSWRGRWEVSIHPVRRKRRGRLGFFVLEAGFSFDEDQKRVTDWSRTRREEFKQQLNRRVQSRDEETFGAFSNALDSVVEAFNSKPSVLATGEIDTGSTVARRSPLWDELTEGIEELTDAVQQGDARNLAKVFGRWTFRCSPPR